MQIYHKTIGKCKQIDITNFFSSKPVPFDMVLPGFVKGKAGSLISPGGVGKSWFVLEAATCIATANIAGGNIMRFHGLVPGETLILSAEDDAQVMHHRLHALGSHYKSDELRQAICERVHIVPTCDDDIDVLNPAHRKQIIEMGRGCRLIVLDTAARYHCIDENKASEVKPVIHAIEAIARATEAAVLMPMHSAKAAALLNQGDLQQSGKGSAVWTDHPRWVANLIGMSKEEAESFGMTNDERKNFVRHAVSKQNYGPPLPDTWFRRCNGGVLLPVHLEKQPKPQRRTGMVANADDYRSRARGG